MDLSGIDDAILKAYARLLVYEFQYRLARITRKIPEKPSNVEIAFLLSSASYLALEAPQDNEKRAARKGLAYDIASRLAILNEDSPAILAAVDCILARLGNFPGRELLETRFPRLADARPNILLRLESENRKEENTLHLNNENKVVLTDFQINLFRNLHDKNILTLSAPTSAGKSFSLSLDIARKLAENPSSCIAYVVPTRALIRQVMKDVNGALRRLKLESVAVLSAPVPLDDIQKANGIVYVLTQERLMTLLFASTPVSIDALYVDEAQELDDDERGMVLHSAIEITLRRFPKAKVVFSSPLTSNPEFLINEFKLPKDATVVKELESPVSQSLIFLNSVPGNDSAINVGVLAPTGLQQVTTLGVKFAFRGVIRRLANTAYLLTARKESSIVYANQPSDAEEIAGIIADLSPSPKEVPREILDFIAFIRTHVSEHYSLVELLPKGVAFHYGQMPALVRTGVEDLLRQGKIRFVCCTSTLLQGVNLPAKNIFIQAPRRGNGKPMTSAAFWNLAGRAGRLRDRFNGNVWCLEVSNWKHNPLEGGRLTEIRSAFRDALESKSCVEAIANVIHQKMTGSDGSEEEQAFAKIFAEFTLANESLSKSHYATDENLPALLSIEKECEAIKKQIHLPREILEKNSSISPWRLEALYRKFGNVKDIALYCPVDPRSGGIASIRRIFYILELGFFKTGKRSYRYYAALAFFWIRGETLAALIANKIKYNKAEGKTKEINRLIRQLLEDLERTLHFKYVKFLRAYNDVLNYYLVGHGRIDLAAKIAPLHLYIEFGASDPVLISLMSLGVSRTTAILLRKSIGSGWQEIRSRGDLSRRLAGINLEKTNLPLVCQNEIRDFLG